MRRTLSKISQGAFLPDVSGSRRPGLVVVLLWLETWLATAN